MTCDTTTLSAGTFIEHVNTTHTLMANEQAPLLQCAVYTTCNTCHNMTAIAMYNNTCTHHNSMTFNTKTHNYVQESIHVEYGFHTFIHIQYHYSAPYNNAPSDNTSMKWEVLTIQSSLHPNLMGTLWCYFQRGVHSPFSSALPQTALPLKWTAKNAGEWRWSPQ